MTYNIHHCRGINGFLSSERIVRVIAQYTPDIVALQELDVNRSRTQRIDQAHQIAQALNMEYHFHPSFTVEEEQYGNAILSRLPLRIIKAEALPGSEGLEPRGAIWAEIECGDHLVQVINTHLGLRPWERLVQIRALLGADWLKHPGCLAPVIFCGDFNVVPISRVYRRIANRFQDVARMVAKPGFLRTWRGMIRLDYIFTSPDIAVINVMAPRSSLTKRASDHLPMIADLRIIIKERRKFTCGLNAS